MTVYANVVTVEAPAARWDELEGPVSATIEHLLEYHGDGAGWWWEARGLPVPVPPAPPEFTASTQAAEAPAAGGGGEGSEGTAEGAEAATA